MADIDADSPRVHIAGGFAADHRVGSLIAHDGDHVIDRTQRSAALGALARLVVPLARPPFGHRLATFTLL